MTIRETAYFQKQRLYIFCAAPLKVTLSWEDSILRQLYKSWLPLDAGILLQEDFYLHEGDGLVSWIWRPDGNE